MRTIVSQTELKLFHDAMEVKGVAHMFRKCSEEAGEFIAALSHYQDGKISFDALQSEMADVSIVVTQLAHYMGNMDYESTLDLKMNEFMLKTKRAIEEKSQMEALITI